MTHLGRGHGRTTQALNSRPYLPVVKTCSLYIWLCSCDDVASARWCERRRSCSSCELVHLLDGIDGVSLDVTHCELVDFLRHWHYTGYGRLCMHNTRTVYSGYFVVVFIGVTVYRAPQRCMRLGTKEEELK